MLSAFRDHLKERLLDYVGEHHPTFVPVKSLARRGGILWRDKMPGVSIFLSLEFVRDRDDILMLGAWSPSTKPPSEDLLYQPSSLSAQNMLEAAPTEGWLHPGLFDCRTFAFEPSPAEPPLEMVQAALREADGTDLRSAFSWADPDTPESLDGFGWELLELFHGALPRHTIESTLSSPLSSIEHLVTRHYVPTLQGIAARA